MDKKVAFYTLGCKLNFSETSTIARSFQDEGFQKVEFNEHADIYVINTCSVTENADKRFKTIVKQAQKSNEDAFIVGVGCYAQLKPEELAAVDGVDLVLGATEKFKEAALIEKDNAKVMEGLYRSEVYSRIILKINKGQEFIKLNQLDEAQKDQFSNYSKPMKTALAFTDRIKTSKTFAEKFEDVTREFEDTEEGQATIKVLQHLNERVNSLAARVEAL